MHSRLFTRVRDHVRPGRIRAAQARPEPAKAGICQHRTAGSANRGRMCHECGLPVIYVPGAAVA